MFFSTANLPPGAAYKLLSGSVVPRPIALVTSLSKSGAVNAAPFSFFNVLGCDPPTLALNIGNRDAQMPKDSAQNIVARGEFVVNLVARGMAEAMNICATDFPPEISEIEAAKLELGPSQIIQTPRLAASPASFECISNQVVQIGNNRVIFGEVVGFHFAPNLACEENFRVETEKLGLIGRMGGNGGYVATTDTFEIGRISYEKWRDNQKNSG